MIAVSPCGPRTSFPQELAAFRAVTSLNGRYSEPFQRIQGVGVVVAEHPLPVRQQLTEESKRLTRIAQLARPERDVAAGG